jgi:hypothetical protein
MFQHPTWRIKKLLQMHRNCPKCNQDLIPEPGFYFGAMYFSYAINVALMVIFGVGYEILFHPENLLHTFASVFLPPILAAPWTFRISRALTLYTLGGISREIQH